MKSKIFILFLLYTGVIFSQNSFKAIIKDSLTNESLIGVNAFIESIDKGAASDLNGKIEIRNIPDGNYTIVFSYVGYKTKELRISFPENNPNKIRVLFLQQKSVELNQIIVSSTRTENRISNTPVRVEVLGPDEVNEEIGIKPGNISKLLGETSGVLLQQTSAASGNVAFRIQGLPAEYTQLLSDGFPIYSGFSSGLSLLQIPPLNLQQVEVVKGSASTLYGGDAIAGIVNLVTKLPSEIPKFSFLFNQTQKGETDFSGYFTGRKNKFGLTTFSDYNIQKAVDVDHDGFTDIPKFQQVNIAPKLFYYINGNQTLSVQLSFSYDHRKGGDLLAVNGKPDSLHKYLLENKSLRYISEFKYKYNFSGGSSLTFKNSLNSYYRKINSLSDVFSGTQFTTFTELSYLMNLETNKFVFGLNFNSDKFSQVEISPVNFNYNYYTLGLFAMDNWEINDNLIWQLGFRTDYQNKYKYFVLPQSFLLYKINKNFDIRLGGGLGYKIPTAFTNEAEERIFNDVMPISPDIKAERSYSLSADLNYKTILFNIINLNFNQAFYYTQVTHPVMLGEDSLSLRKLPGYYFYNSLSELKAKGFDTNIHLSLEDFEFYFEYTYTHAEQVFSNYSNFLQLTPKSKINITLTLEDENNWRTGFEAFYTGREYLNNGTKSPDYWTIGLMFQKYFNHFSVIANVENLFDVRQTKYEKIYNPPISNPTFKQIYAPLDGVVANIAVNIVL
jgi:iron complex outermembrane receptor protein